MSLSINSLGDIFAEITQDRERLKKEVLDEIEKGLYPKDFDVFKEIQLRDLYNKRTPYLKTEEVKGE